MLEFMNIYKKYLITTIVINDKDIDLSFCMKGLFKCLSC